MSYIAFDGSSNDLVDLAKGLSHNDSRDLFESRQIGNEEEKLLADLFEFIEDSRSRDIINHIYISSQNLRVCYYLGVEGLKKYIQALEEEISSIIRPKSCTLLNILDFIAVEDATLNELRQEERFTSNPRLWAMYEVLRVIHDYSDKHFVCVNPRNLSKMAFAKKETIFAFLDNISNCKKVKEH